MSSETAFTPDALSARAFRDALGCFATGITVVTIDSAEGPMGFVANSFSSLSMNPPLVLWSPARASRRFRFFADAPHYVIHVLAEDQTDWIARFGRDGGGFSGLDVPRNSEGVPLIPGALARFDCAQHGTHDGGDHLIIVGRVLRFTLREGAPLVFSQGAWGGFAHGG